MSGFRPKNVSELLPWVHNRRDAGETITCEEQPGQPMLDRPCLLDRSDLQAVRFFDPDDMVVGVEAGISWQTLQTMLIAKGMWLPVSPWDANLTMGVMCDHNQFGRERLMGGGLRDFLIGMEYINGQGALVRVGGKVVKNVTGYDLGRMMIGARGGLGIVTALHFRVMPCPVEPRIWLRHDRPEAILAGLAEAWAARLPLDSIQIRMERDKAILEINYSGRSGRRKRLATELTKILGASDAPEPSTAVRFREQLEGDKSGSKQHPDTSWWKGVLESFGRCGSGGEFWHLFIVFATEFGLDQTVFNRIGHACDALIWHPVGGDAHLFIERSERAGARLTKLLEELSKLQCFISVVRGPQEIARQLHPSRPLPPGYELMRHLKQVLDPDNLFYSPFFNQAG